MNDNEFFLGGLGPLVDRRTESDGVSTVLSSSAADIVRCVGSEKLISLSPVAGIRTWDIVECTSALQL